MLKENIKKLNDFLTSGRDFVISNVEIGQRHQFINIDKSTLPENFNDFRIYYDVFKKEYTVYFLVDEKGTDKGYVMEFNLKQGVLNERSKSIDKKFSKAINEVIEDSINYFKALNFNFSFTDRGLTSDKFTTFKLICEYDKNTDKYEILRENRPSLHILANAYTDKVELYEEDGSKFKRLKVVDFTNEQERVI